MPPQPHASPFPDEITCGGVCAAHLQGIAVDDAGAIYWSFTRDLVKTDAHGSVLCRVPAPSHHGDLEWRDGKVYVAVNLGKFNQEPGLADSWVYVYDADDLSLVEKLEAQEVVHGAGGVAYHDGRFIVIGGLPEGREKNYAYVYDEALRFRERHVIESGYTRLGIQTACWARGFWWFGCYGKTLLKTDPRFRLVGKYRFNCAVGLAALPGARFLIGRCFGEHRGRALVAREDAAEAIGIDEQ